MDFEEELMIKAAWYYYFEKKTQQTISDLLGISRMKVIRLPDKAQQTGVIQFAFREDSARKIKIEKELIDAYNLKDSFVIPTPRAATIAEINDAIAAAAMYISARIQPHAFINIGYGDTMGKTLNTIAKYSRNPHFLYFLDRRGEYLSSQYPIQCV